MQRKGEGDREIKVQNLRDAGFELYATETKKEITNPTFNNAYQDYF